MPNSLHWKAEKPLGARINRIKKMNQSYFRGCHYGEGISSSLATAHIKAFMPMKHLHSFLFIDFRSIFVPGTLWQSPAREVKKAGTVV